MNYKHGMTKTSTFQSWNDMIQRCTNPKRKFYPNYGGRGITVCERWKTFSNFLQDMGPKPDDSYSINRIDNNKNYELSNCKWDTRENQNNNRSNTHYLTHEGITLNLKQWATKLDIPYGTIQSRYHRGFLPHEILSKIPFRLS